MVKIIPAKQQQQMPIATCFISFCEYPILSKKPQNKIETKMIRTHIMPQVSSSESNLIQTVFFLDINT